MQAEQRAAATADEQQVLARWGGWGAQGLWQTTAAIAQALYPQAEVRAESFADTRLPADLFDPDHRGNVPFADITLHDPRHNASRHRMHNHFIIKSLGLTRPGGMVALLTSQHTMDARNPAARREMNDLADLVTAVRLPSGAHRRAAGRRGPLTMRTATYIVNRTDPAATSPGRSSRPATCRSKVRSSRPAMCRSSGRSSRPAQCRSTGRSSRAAQ